MSFGRLCRLFQCNKLGASEVSGPSIATHLRRAARERARAEREYERAVVRQAKEEARSYAESRQQEAEDSTKDIKVKEELISSLLGRAATEYKAFDFDSSKKKVNTTSFESTVTELVEPREVDYQIPDRTFFARLLPGSLRRLHRRRLAARMEYEKLAAEHQDNLARRNHASQLYYARQEKLNKEVATHNSNVDELKIGLAAGRHDAIVSFYHRICNDSFSEDFDAISAEVGYSERSRHLVVDIELPSIDVIPEDTGYRYVKSADRIDTLSRPIAKRKNQYANLIAQICLKCLCCIFTSAQGTGINCLSLNAMLDGIDPATGKRSESV